MRELVEILQERIMEKTGVKPEESLKRIRTLESERGVSRLEACKILLDELGLTMGFPPSMRRKDTKRTRIKTLLGMSRPRQDVELQGFVSFLSKLDLYPVCRVHRRAFSNNRCPVEGCDERVPDMRPSLFFRLHDETGEIMVRCIDEMVLMILDTNKKLIESFIKNKVDMARENERKNLPKVFKNVIGSELTVSGFVGNDGAFGRTLIARFFEYTDVESEIPKRTAYKELDLPEGCKELLARYIH